MVTYEQINTTLYYNEVLSTKKEEIIDFNKCQKILDSFESYSKKLDKLIETVNTEKNNYKD